MLQNCFSKSRKYKRSIFSFALILIFILISCEKVQASKPLAIIDDLQRKVELPLPAVRIVSLSDSHTENLVELRAVRQLVGVSFSADSKWVLKNIPRLSWYPTTEQIAELRPDIVIMDTDWAKKNRTLLKEFDKAKKQALNIELIEIYKDITYETLIEENFFINVKEAYPLIDWERPYKEFNAIKEKSSKKNPGCKAENTN